MKLRAGTIIDDTWVIEASLGEGGMGSVYRAHNRHAPRIKSAIKMLSRELIQHAEANTRFVREAEILFGLDHPHIVKVRNVRLDHSPPYIEMEFIEGVSLHEMLESPPIPLDRALLFTEQLGSALRYLHRHKVYHRDIKPSNLLVRKGTMLKLVDFGLAVDVDESERITQAGTHFGTVAYAPPEWIRPQDMEPKLWDLYAMGVILYEMLTGDVPFQADAGANPRQAAIQVMTVKQQLPYLDPGPRHPDSLRALVQDLTARAPVDRVQDARDVIARLQLIQQEMSFNADSVLASGLAGDELNKAVHERHMEVSRPHTLHEGSEAPPPPPPPPPPRAARKPVAAPPPATTVPPERAPRRLALLVMVAVVGLLLIAGVAALTAGSIMVGRSWLAPTARPLALLVTGVQRHTPVRLQVDGQPAERIDGLHHHFAPVEPGDHTVAWSTGPGCADAPCPGEGCPDTCRIGAGTITVPPGDGATGLSFEVQPPEARDVDVPFPNAPEGTVVRVNERDVPVVDGAIHLRNLMPGSYPMEASAGTCPEGARGCDGDPGVCPEGCSSRVFDLHLPADGVVRVPPLTLTPPKAARPAPKRSSTGGRRPVTRGAYATWVVSHPEWSRDRAVAEGRADGSYLQGIDLASLRSKPVVSVPWAAAQAYCGGRLTGLSQEPSTWDEGAIGLFQEWRSDGGSPAWRRYDGATSSQLSQRESNAFTGFRCR